MSFKLFGRGEGLTTDLLAMVSNNGRDDDTKMLMTANLTNIMSLIFNMAKHNI